MRNLKRILPSILLILVLVVSAIAPLSVNAATAPATYSATSNSGQRDVVCTTLEGTSAASYYKNYNYDDLSTKSASALFTSLQTLMRETHNNITSYDDCHYEADKTDCQNEDGSVSLIYTGYSATMGQWNGWNREHVWPQSLGGDNTSGGGADLHHIRPSDAGVNSSRGNKKYGESGSNATEKYGSNPAVGVLGGTYNSTYFEPLDNVKGDVARICLYVYVRWNSNWGASDITDVFQSVDVLLKWCQEDPVDTWEMGRNEVIGAIQGNRNVFIDYPEYAWLIFGEEVPTNMTTPSGKAACGSAGGSGNGGNTGDGDNTGNVGGGNSDVVVPGGSSATLTFDDKSKRTAFSTSEQVWEENGIIFTNSKASSSNAVADFANPVRLYAKSSITIEGSKNIERIEITCNSSDYAGVLQTSIGGAASASGNVVTVTLSTPQKSFTVASLTAQTRLNSLTVYYEDDGSSDCEHNYESAVTAPTCTAYGYTTHTCTKCGNSYTDSTVPATGHKDTTENVQDATCTENGLRTVVCNDCRATVSTEIIKATGHSYVDGTCTECGHTGSGSGPAAGTEIIFDFGDNISGGHADGGDLGSSATYTSGSYTLKITGASKIYKNAYDEMGNSALKFGSSSAVGTMTFTVPDDVTSVIIHAAKYKAKNSVIVVNGTAQTLVSSSDAGVYDVITVDTSTDKTITISTNSSGYRMMVDKIIYVVGSGSSGCEHNYESAVTAPTCTADGYTTHTCTECGDSYTDSTVPATGHKDTTENVQDATCTANGLRTVICNDCGVTVSSEVIEATGHSYVNGTCTECGDKLSTYTATFQHPEGSYSSSVAGSTLTMPGAPTLTGSYKKDYVFVGWVTSTVDDTTAQPTVYREGDEVEISENTTFHALYSYTSTSGSGNSNVFEKYSGTITEGDYIICYNSYAMKNVVSSSRLSYLSITPSNGIITSPDASIIWRIEADGTYYTLYNEAVGKYAAGTGANNKAQLLSSISNYARWTVSGSSTYEFVNAGNTGNKNLRNNGTYGFACYSTSTGGALTLYKRAEVTEVINYTTSPEFDCAHTNTTTETVPATCTAPGSITVTCNICGNTVSSEVIEATGHSFVDGVCVGCGDVEQGGTTDSSEGEWTLVTDVSDLKAGDKIVIVSGTFATGNISNQIMASLNGVVTSDNKITTLPDGAIILTLGGSSGAWTLANESGQLLGATAVKKLAWNGGTTTWSITISGDSATIQNGTSSYGRILYNATSPRFTTYTSNTSSSMLLPKIYKLTGASGDSEGVKISAASVTVGSTLAMNYYVSGYDASKEYYMVFTINGITSERILGIEKNGYLMFTFEDIPPQCMADNISASLYSADTDNPEATLENYSIKVYAERIIAKHSSNDKLMNIVIDMLRYGAAAQTYLNYNTNNLATDNLETNGFNINAMGSNATPTENIRSIVYHKEKNPALTFVAAGVRFDFDNKVYVKIAAESLDGVSVKINGNNATIAPAEDGEYIIYSEGISALGFGNAVEFTLYSGSEKLETLTYSINSYAYSKYDDGNVMADLALALYRYGLSAKDYRG